MENPLGSYPPGGFLSLRGYFGNRHIISRPKGPVVDKFHHKEKLNNFTIHFLFLLFFDLSFSFRNTPLLKLSSLNPKSFKILLSNF